MIPFLIIDRWGGGSQGWADFGPGAYPSIPRDKSSSGTQGKGSLRLDIVSSGGRAGRLSPQAPSVPEVDSVHKRHRHDLHQTPDS